MRRVFLPQTPFFQVLTSVLRLQKWVGRQKKALTMANNRSSFGAGRRNDGFAPAHKPFHSKTAVFCYCKAWNWHKVGQLLKMQNNEQCLLGDKTPLNNSQYELLTHFWTFLLTSCTINCRLSLSVFHAHVPRSCVYVAAWKQKQIYGCFKPLRLSILTQKWRQNLKKRFCGKITRRIRYVCC